MGKKRKNGDLVKFPVHRAGAKAAAPARKMSEIVKEMALRLLKEPDAVSSRPAIESALLFATAAWNFDLGEPAFRNQHREILKKFDWGSESPWAELRSSNTDQLIAELVEYKQTHHPNDRRLIVAAGLSPEDQVQVQWVDEDKVVAAAFGSQPPKAAAVGAKRGHPIAEKLVANMKRHVHGKVTNLKEVIAGRAAAGGLQKTVVTKEGLEALHPAHAVYVYVQNQVSVIAEQLSGLDELTPFVDIVSKAEDLYLPSGPPMSPLTTSYFSCWAFFDTCVGAADETIGTTMLEVCGAFGMNGELLRLIRLMQESRMGVYVHEGTEGELAVLRELATGSVCRALVPSGYRGQSGELWYARVLPPPMTGMTEHVVFTTPYVLLKPGLREWQAYFRRAGVDAHERHMKYGSTRAYWNDFVFEGYVNHQTEAIYLAGLPDVAESRPHSAVNR